MTREPSARGEAGGGNPGGGNPGGGHVNTPFDDILDTLAGHADEGRVTVGRVREELGDKGLGALLFLPAILEISPIGGVPGVPTVLATIIVIVAAQVLMGRRSLWLPDLLERRSVSGETLKGAVDWLRRPARFIDRHFHDRMRWLTTPPLDRVVALACLALACSVPPLELFPFASTIPMAGIALLGLALLFDDGLLVLAGLALALGTIAVGAYWLL